MRRPVSRLGHAAIALEALLVVLWCGRAAAEQAECAQWAQRGECTKNPDFMNVNCLKACSESPLDAAGEPEQCAGWAAQGECTRNPKFMMTDCPRSCKDQRKKMHEGALDDRPDCLDVAKTAEQCGAASVREGCKGTCMTHTLCADEADPPECERALRCRELKDDWADCASRVEKQGCEAVDSAASLLKHCYLSCARVGRASLLRRFRQKFTVRTRKHSFIDEEGRAAWRPAFSSPWSLPCWQSTVFDPLPPATCASDKAAMVRRWRKLAHPRCRALRETTPRAPPRRNIPLPSEHQPSRELPAAASALGSLLTLGGGRRAEEAEAGNGGAASAGLVELGDPLPPVSVLPLLTSPKLRLVENFVSAEEAQHVIDVGLPHMHRSLAGGRTESIRTSTTGMLPAHDPVVRRITERAALITGYPYANIEPLQLVKYVDGQKYEPHFDYGEACDFEENLYYGHRHVTMLVYLNSVPVERGGYTAFPKLDIRVNPQAYSAVVFNDCLPNGEEDPRTLHGGSPPANFTKIAINIWIRAQARSNPNAAWL